MLADHRVETAGRSLEGRDLTTIHLAASIHITILDMDVIFALAYNEGVSPVSVSLRKDLPAAGTPEADRILFPDRDASPQKSAECLNDGP